ncbi:MAG: AAA family ATPase [Simkania negevensis]|nr:AAA family ATPase [Simkania negevensis]
MHITSAEKKQKRKAFFIAATGQHVGKTTTCLGLLSGLKKRFSHVGFIKPIGQEHIEVSPDLKVDKDVVLFKEHFGLKTDYAAMSPVLFSRGFTRDYLDGKINEEAMLQKVHKAFHTVKEENDFVIVEGTGHVGVGSIANLSNAKVAASLGLSMIIVASGGLGSSFDALAVNKALCDQCGVKVAGVIINRVLDEKRKMVAAYMAKALDRWRIPVLGCIPFDPFLSRPSMRDFEALFGATLLSGEEFHMRHFRHMRLAATSLKNFRALILPSQLIITPSNREDIILATLSKHWDIKIANPNEDLEAGFILTGETAPRPVIVEALKKANIPMIYAPVSSYAAMTMITSYTVKIRKEDKEKINEAIHLVEKEIDFEGLLRATR